MKSLPIAVAVALLFAAYLSGGGGQAPVPASPTGVASDADDAEAPRLVEVAPLVRSPAPVVVDDPGLSSAEGLVESPATGSGFAAAIELEGLRSRVAWLEAELVLCGSESAAGPMADWLAVLRPDERPSTETLRLMVEYLRPYPVALTVNEGLWIAERIAADDWKSYGRTVDEVLIQYLGAGRLAAELTAEQLEPLLELWDDEGFFR